MLGHLLHLHGVDSVIVETRSEPYVIERVRAGVLEQGSVDLLRDSGVGHRLAREGLRHDGIYLAVRGARHRIDMASLTGGRAITVYGQNEIVKDLIEARRAAMRPLFFDAANVSVHAIDRSPSIACDVDGESHTIRCDLLAGCDGFHGICRPAIPSASLRTFEREYPFAWLGILAQARPSSEELVYALHDHGFALFSMRSPTVTRLYLQCGPTEDIAAWSDDRIWSELLTRLETADGWRPNQGPILQKSITPMRSFVAEPMRHGRLFLAGDAAHIVPPTGAKGLNLALADVSRLATAISAFYRTGSEDGLDRYSNAALRRTWRAQRFSWWMTSMLHKSDSQDPFDHRLQLAELDALLASPAAMTSFAENYVGLALD